MKTVTRERGRCARGGWGELCSTMKHAAQLVGIEADHMLMSRGTAFRNPVPLNSSDPHFSVYTWTPKICDN